MLDDTGNVRANFVDVWELPIQTNPNPNTSCSHVKIDNQIYALFKGLNIKLCEKFFAIHLLVKG